jgi:hypothetical protein
VSRNDTRQSSLCRVSPGRHLVKNCKIIFAECRPGDTWQRLLCRVPLIWHSAKRILKLKKSLSSARSRALGKALEHNNCQSFLSHSLNLFSCAAALHAAASSPLRPRPPRPCPRPWPRPRPPPRHLPPRPRLTHRRDLASPVAVPSLGVAPAQRRRARRAPRPRPRPSCRSPCPSPAPAATLAVPPPRPSPCPRPPGASPVTRRLARAPWSHPRPNLQGDCLLYVLRV